MFARCSSTTNGIATINGCFFPLIATFIYWGLLLSGTVAIIMIILGGIKIITSHGNAKTLDGARKTISFAILGLILSFLSFFIINFIGTTTGVACIQYTTGGPIPTFTSCR